MTVRAYDMLTPDRETDRQRKDRILYEKWYDDAGNKECNICHEYKKIEEYSKKKTMFDGLQNVCKQCARTIVLETRTAKKDDFELADAYNLANNTKVAIVNEIIKRSLTGRYDI